MYHYVRPINESTYPDIKGLELEGFVRQLKYFKNNFKIITATQLLNCIYNNSDLPKDTLVLTFDDGFKDHYLHVFPILKKFDISGLFFPSAKPLEEHSVLDVHKIHFILANYGNIQNVLSNIFSLIKQNEKEFNLEKPEEYYKKLAIPNRFDSGDIIFIKRILQRDLPQKLRNTIIDYLFKNYVSNNEEGFSKNLYLSYDEIKEMKENSMFFGSHGYSHQWLGYLGSKELEKELDLCSKLYSKINNDKNSWIMCYPYGNYNKDVIEKAKKFGYKAGLTTEVGDAILDKKNALALSRYDTNDFPQ